MQHKSYLHFQLFVATEMAQMVEIIPGETTGPSCMVNTTAADNRMTKGGI